MKYLMAVGVLALLVSCNEGNTSFDAENNIRISANYPEASDQMVILMHQGDEGAVSLDTGYLEQGMVELNASALEFAQPVYVKFETLRRPFLLFEKSGDIVLDIKGEGPQMQYTYSGGAYSSKVNRYFEVQREVQTKMDELNAAYQSAMSIGDTESTKDMTVQAEVIMQQKTMKLTALAQESGAFGALIAAQDLYDSDEDVLETIYNDVPEANRTSPLVMQLKDRIDVMKRVAVGQPFVDIAQNDTTGMMIKLSDHLGTFTLVDFWASWCGPCRAENPNVVSAFNKYKDKGFTVVGVSLDQSKRNWIDAINNDQLYWPQMSDLAGWQNAGAAQYGVRAIPQNVMLDQEGIIVAKNLREEELHDWLESNL